MDALVETLETKLRQWKPDVAEQVKQYVAAIIEMADQDALDILHSRDADQQALDSFEESAN
ncbi:MULTISPECIES: hypothetical protein [Calothrix]|uniref:Uncharacterized protein n=2 Tax=Calothrix TaxID=1186 RepID=A0ABR8A932_9CYAN|nr:MULTISPECIES: hypothetical protein [Calothrix]MBD2195960.1 hypothetical protein [Calothrix parietina FACHB-288]MBD2224550.1 hypothetical protein [Calothrix anomala FACHB-343]BAY64296.1 hypothetical protein NIES22_43920 [Calothrix brevissima NIES-22]